LGPPGYEINLLYIACLVVLILGGAGPFSIDALRSRRHQRPLRVAAQPIDPLNHGNNLKVGAGYNVNGD
jgi:hypothetical protein